MPRRRNKPKRVTAHPVRAHRVDCFDARAYFLETVAWFTRWPARLVEELEQRGFRRISLEQVAPHPVWHLRLRCPAQTLNGKDVNRTIRKVVEQAGCIPRGGFICLTDRRGRVEAAFVLDA